MAPIPFQMPNAMAAEHEESKGWSFINIVLVLLLLFSCIASIVNLMSGEIPAGISCIILLCLCCWSYSYYNRHDPNLQKLQSGFGGININLTHA
jgi:hypothetical protein